MLSPAVRVLLAMSVFVGYVAAFLVVPQTPAEASEHWTGWVTLTNDLSTGVMVGEREVTYTITDYPAVEGVYTESQYIPPNCDDYGGSRVTAEGTGTGTLYLTYTDWYNNNLYNNPGVYEWYVRVASPWTGTTDYTSESFGCPNGSTSTWTAPCCMDVELPFTVNAIPTGITDPNPTAIAGTYVYPNDPSYVYTFAFGAENEPIFVDFEWSMPDRMRVDYENMKADFAAKSEMHPAVYLRPGLQVNPDAWQIDFNACNSIVPEPADDVVYSFSVDGEPLDTAGGCSGTTYLPPDANGRDFQFSVEVSANGNWGFAEEVVSPRDFLILVLGDSYASGEGNPEFVAEETPGPLFRPSQDGPCSGTLRTIKYDHCATWQDGGPGWSADVADVSRCHRSGWAASARAAARLEASDPHSSVTFVHLACTGATLLQGILDPYDGTSILKGLPGRDKSQIDEALEIADGRRYDFVTVSIGGNDIGFGDILLTCVKDKCNEGDTADEILLAVNSALSPSFHQRLEDCLTAADTCSEGEGDIGPGLGVNSDRILWTQYPDFSKNDNGGYCGEGNSTTILGDLPIAKYLRKAFTAEEAEWADKNIMSKLNSFIQGGPFLTLLPSLADFDRNGYCADERLFVTWRESMAGAGGIYGQGNKLGAVHPNREGHAIFADLIYEYMVVKLGVGS